MSKAIETFDLSYTQNRELSWLNFNSRVLDQAADPDVPLMERFRFLSIFTSNLDEFFMVRVGSLFDVSIMDPKAIDNKSGMTPIQQLDSIYDAVLPLIRKRDALYKDLMKRLAKRDIVDLNDVKVSDDEKSYIRRYFKDFIRPLLSPQIIDPTHPFPHLKNKTLYIAALLKDKKNYLLGLVAVPDSMPSVIQMPETPGHYIRPESIIEHYIKKIFPIYTIEEHAIVSVTRNADITFDEEKFDEDNPDFLSTLSKLLRKRDRLQPVRLEMQGDAPKLLGILADRLKLTRKQCYTSYAPLLLSYAYDLKDLKPIYYYPARTPDYPDYLRKDISMWKQVEQRDVLLFYPYHSMDPFLALLKEAARDPEVVSIQITIYRLAKNSAVIKYLMEAAENGKDVTALIELRARFDEQNNIDWAKVLEDSGCRIIYGVDEYKCHSKLCLITKRTGHGQLRFITQIGTGNYNEKTAAQYTDFCLMTANPAIAEDAVAFFQNMLIGNTNGNYHTLLVAPNRMKSELIRLIDREIAKGEEGRIVIKANSVTERDLIDKFAEASSAGVKIDLIIRGICCLVAGIPGKTENITVTSIVGRFLEHSRIYAFGKGEEAEIYISSADLMTRNQTRRVEVGCPVLSEEIRSWIVSYLQMILLDNDRAQRMKPDGTYESVVNDAEKINVQSYYLTHPIELTSSTVPAKGFKEKLKSFLGMKRA